MKFQFKALSLTLSLVALLGACTSVNSSTPEMPGSDTSVEISPEGIETETPDLEASEEVEDMELEATDDTEFEDLEASDEYDEELEASDEYDEELEASDDMEDTELEASDDTVIESESAETDTPEEMEEAYDETDEGSDIESNALPIEGENGEVIMPQGVEDEVEAGAEAAENAVPELEPAQ